MTEFSDFADATKIFDHLLLLYPEHIDELNDPPYWIRHLQEELNGWEQVDRTKPKRGKKGKKLEDTVIDADPSDETKPPPNTDGAYLDLWVNGKDLDFITPPRQAPLAVQPPASNATAPNRFTTLEAQAAGSDRLSQHTQAMEARNKLHSWRSSTETFFRGLGFQQIPAPPTGERPLEDLEKDPKVWKMTLPERKKLHEHWVEQAHTKARAIQMDQFEHLKAELLEARTLREEFLDVVSTFN